MKLNVIYHKIWRDLWNHKIRTLQVVLIIAMGTFAIGFILGTRNLTMNTINSSWQEASPPMFMMWARPGLTEEQVAMLKNIEGVEDVEGMMSGNLEWRLSSDDEWQPGELRARADYDNQKFTKVQLLSGEWPQRNVFAANKGSDIYFNVHQGDTIEIRINDKIRSVKIGGIVETRFGEPPAVGGSLIFFTTRQRYGELTGDPDFNVIHGAGPVYDETEVLGAVDRINRQLEKLDIDSGGSGPHAKRVLNPAKHFMQDMLDSLFLILGLVGASCVVLGLFLNYNTINAIITEQVNQIGIMKAIGATNWQIASAYLMMIVVYGLLALLIAVPPAMLGAGAMANFLLNMFNIDALPLTIDLMTLLVQIGIALLSPVLAALIPITAGARITVREAISTYGLGNASTLLDRLMSRLQGLPSGLMLVIGNAFRNKKRVLLTQFTLVSSGLIFMMVINVRGSALNTINNDVPAMHRYQISMQFEEPERIPQIERLTLSRPSVKAVEMWSISGGKIRPAGQAEMGEDDEALTLFGMPTPTQMYGPRLQAGRWLAPDDTRTIVLHQRLAEKVGVSPGDWVTIYHAPKRETSWQVVGIITDPLIANSAYVPYMSLSRKIASVNKANTIWIQTTATDPGFTALVARNLREQYSFYNYQLATKNVFDEGDTITQIVAGMREDYDIVVALLGAMTLLVAVVGSVGLNGMLSLSVLERRREIGVMRAIGATSGKIALIFIGEGLLLGLISWLIALPFSIPLSSAFTQMLASAMDRDIISQFTPLGPIYWLVIMVALSILASWFPARGATRISVRESLAYL